MASARMNSKGFKQTFLEGIGSLLGRLFAACIHSVSGKEALVASLRRSLFFGAQANELPSLINRSALTMWENRIADERSVGEIASGAALARNAWMADVAKNIPQGALVLDAGAGECQYKPLFAHTQYKSQDFAQYQGTADGPQREGWNYGKLDYVCDITDIPVEDNTFDVVVCTEVLEHLSNPIEALGELIRVLKPGGNLILSAPLGCGLHQEPHHYFGGFTPWFYRHYFEKFGVEPVEITPLGGLLQHVAQECNRVGEILRNRADPLSAEGALSGFLANELPRILSNLDKQFKVEEFTVGYVVKGVKKST